MSIWAQSHAPLEQQICPNNRKARLATRKNYSASSIEESIVDLNGSAIVFDRPIDGRGVRLIRAGLRAGESLGGCVEYSLV